MLAVSNRQASDAVQSHLATCERCDEKYRRLQHDLELIGNALRKEMPRDLAREILLPVRARWPRLATAVAVVVVLVFGGLSMWKSSRRPPARSAINSDTQGVLDDLPANPFLLGEAIAKELGIDESDYFDAADWEMERPLEWYDLSPGN